MSVSLMKPNLSCGFSALGVAASASTTPPGANPLSAPTPATSAARLRNPRRPTPVTLSVLRMSCAPRFKLPKKRRHLGWKPPLEETAANRNGRRCPFAYPVRPVIGPYPVNHPAAHQFAPALSPTLAIAVPAVYF